MRAASLILLFGLSTGGCYCSHSRDDDADAAADTGVDSPTDVLPDLGFDAAFDAGPPPTCGVGLFPSGPLCGPGRACALREAVVFEDAGFELFPKITSTGWGDVLVSYRGVDALPVAVIRDGALVETRSAPMASFGSGSFARTPDATFVAGREMGTNDALLVRVEESSFVDTGLDFRGDRFGWGLVGDDAGCVHLLLSNDDGAQYWRVRDGVPWRGPSLGGVLVYGLGIDDVGAMQVVYATRPSGEERVLTWRRDDGEVVEEPIETGPELAQWRVRFGLADGVPHVLYMNRSNPSAAELVYATRREDGWDLAVIEAETRSGCSPDEPSTRPGETCRFEETTYHPLAVLSDATGDVRLLYGEVTEFATLTAECGGEDRPPDACGGWDRESTFEGSVYLANGDLLAEPVIDAPAIDGRAVAEGSTIHAALEIREPDGRALRYVSLTVE